MAIAVFGAAIVDDSAPGKYSSWRVKIPYEIASPLPDCKIACNERCGPLHKGVSVCSSLFEYADKLLPVPTSTESPFVQVKKALILDLLLIKCP